MSERNNLLSATINIVSEILVDSPYILYISISRYLLHTIRCSNTTTSFIILYHSLLYYHLPDLLTICDLHISPAHHSTQCATHIHYLFFFFFLFQKTIRNPYVDIFVAIITVPTLILLALLLDANIQENFDSDVDTSTKSSLIVLIFGFGFIVLSLLVCGCIMHKMGICLWSKSPYTDDDEQTTNGTASNGVHRNSHCGNSRCSNECSHIIDMPPSYETIINGYKCDLFGTDTVPSLSRMAAISAAAPPPTYESLVFEPCVAYDIPLGATSHHI